MLSFLEAKWWVIQHGSCGRLFHWDSSSLDLAVYDLKSSLNYLSRCPVQWVGRDGYGCCICWPPSLFSLFFWVGLMYWLQYCSYLKFVKSPSFFIHLTWMEVSCFTALKIWICLRAMGNKDLFTVANFRVEHLLWKANIALFWVLSSDLQSPLLPKPSSASLERRGWFLRLQGFHSGALRLVSRCETAAVGSGRAGMKLASPWLGWAHGGNDSNTKGSLPFPSRWSSS